jgi:group II intron reverse transcriptase/maturase
MTDAERVRELQRKLSQKAKQDKTFRFFALYDKIYLPYILREAYRRVKANGGSPGVDGMTFRMIEKRGRGFFLTQIHNELRDKTYRPSAVRRKIIPKANGKMRPLGIPTIKDRVVQMACKLVIEPIFEADFEDVSFGFRPARGASDAMRCIKNHLRCGKSIVLDADLSAYFDTIPHDKLLTLVAKRISDGAVIHLLKMWLKAPISEDGRISGGKKNDKGTPQGGVISPLLANIYLHCIDRFVVNPKRGYAQSGIAIVRYADDFVLMGSAIPQNLLDMLKNAFMRMELKLNEEKTRLVDAKRESFNFLGFTIRYDWDPYGRPERYWNIVPSDKSQKKMRGAIDEYLKKHGHASPRDVAKGLNSKLRGWLNYVSIPHVSYPRVAQRDLRYYLFERLHRYYKRKSQRKSKLFRKNAFEVLVEKYGLINPVNHLVRPA